LPDNTMGGCSYAEVVLLTSLASMGECGSVAAGREWGGEADLRGVTAADTDTDFITHLRLG